MVNSSESFFEMLVTLRFCAELIATVCLGKNFSP